MIIPSYENALLWHERDLANSSSERFTLSHSMILLDDVMVKCDRVLSGLEVNRTKMKENIVSQNGLIMAEKVMLELVDRGMPRDMAHEVLRSASMTAVETGSNLESVCRDSESIMDLFDEDEIPDLFEPESHLGSSIKIVNRAIEIAREESSEK
jgi:adenylosuccinate lyase